MKVYFATDHAGLELKNELVRFAREELGLDAEDCGAFTFDKDDDYPDFIAAAARKLSEDVQEGIGSRAVVVGASGQGEAMVANRFKGVRCALYYGEAGHQIDMSGKSLDMLSSSRDHNDANCISFAARFLSESEIKEALKKWLNTSFPGEERHARRIKKIDSVS